ncbi:hypothetical protein EDD29_5238 [Actinocorallia herbida]|uniref:Uncharacterized protein n=1 Tax=Actinocorallia herbida TaxID=58109 RepID=A0A3N1D2B1_9ACTN|nr:hypothetical protein EDD29_5238 [Actinocorallia herbida]
MGAPVAGGVDRGDPRMVGPQVGAVAHPVAGRHRNLHLALRGGQGDTGDPGEPGRGRAGRRDHQVGGGDALEVGAGGAGERVQRTGQAGQQADQDDDGRGRRGAAPCRVTQVGLRQPAESARPQQRPQEPAGQGNGQRAQRAEGDRSEDRDGHRDQQIRPVPCRNEHDGQGRARTHPTASGGRPSRGWHAGRRAGRPAGAPAPRGRRPTAPRRPRRPSRNSPGTFQRPLLVLNLVLVLPRIGQTGLHDHGGILAHGVSSDSLRHTLRGTVPVVGVTLRRGCAACRGRRWTLPRCRRPGGGPGDRAGSRLRRECR